MKRKAPRFNLFCWTLYNHDEPIKPSCFDYQGGVQETCPSTGKLHWQCFGYSRNAMTCTALNKYLPRVHVEPCKGSLEDNEKYCSPGKGCNDTTFVPDTHYLQGDRPAQGHRSDLDLAAKQAMDGDLKAINPATYVKYHRGLQALHNLHSVPYAGPRHVYWFWGDTNTGKSRTAFYMFPHAYRQSSDAGWFDTYCGQPDVIIDDYAEGVLSIREFLCLTDRYPYHVKVKGSMAPWKAVNIVFTSHYPPFRYFPADRWPEVNRRITEIRPFVSGGD